jgi:signal peptidase II
MGKIIKECLNMYRGFWLCLSGLIVGLDQWTKWLAVTHLHLNVPYYVLPVFNLTLAYNRGAAFSFLASMGGWQVIVLSSISILASIFVAIWLCKTPKGRCLQSLALSLILGGALGNLIDRLRLHYVVDFLQFHYHDWYFAIFNIADSAVSVGVFFLLISIVFQKEHTG